MLDLRYNNKSCILFFYTYLYMVQIEKTQNTLIIVQWWKTQFKSDKKKFKYLFSYGFIK